MIQLYDQAVREQSGGEFLKYLQRSAIPNEDFVCSRSGEARRIMQKVRGRPLDGSRSATRTRSSWPLFRGWPGLLRSAILRVILGEKDYAALRVARFGRVARSIVGCTTNTRLRGSCDVLDLRIRNALMQAKARSQGGSLTTLILNPTARSTNPTRCIWKRSSYKRHLAAVLADSL
jgi:hypothetical protein